MLDNDMAVASLLQMLKQVHTLLPHCDDSAWEHEPNNTICDVDRARCLLEGWARIHLEIELEEE